jgi:hypothetical protein
VGVVGGEDDFDSALVELRGEAVDSVVALVFFGCFVDGANDDRNLEAGYVVEDGLRVADVVENELEFEFLGEADGGLQVAGTFSGKNDCLLAFEIWDQSFEF